MSQWLNTFFAPLDSFMFETVNAMAIKCENVLTPFFKIVSLLGEKGLLFFLLSAILMLFARTRKLGICMFGAVACGAIITNLILKDIICRLRPFEEVEKYAEYWKRVGSPEEDGYSFPSGHVTAISSAMSALFILCNKKWSWIGIPCVLIMGFSRIYLIAHYTSDVIAGIFVGIVAGIIASIISALIYFILDKYENNKFFAFVRDANIVGLFNKDKENNE